MIQALTTLESPRLVILYGPSGVGKTTIAKIYSKWINCTSENKPCGECDNCKNYQLLIPWDVPTQNKVADVADMITIARQAVPKGCKRVILADEVHGLSAVAFDKLLDFLESKPVSFTGEPLDFPTVFIFTTTEINKVPETIRSRGKELRFAPISKDDMYDRLVEICSPEAAEFITNSSNGNLRAALQQAELAKGDNWKEILETDSNLVEIAATTTNSTELWLAVSKGVRELGITTFVERLLCRLEDSYVSNPSHYKRLIDAAYGVQFSTSDILAMYKLYSELEGLNDAPSNVERARLEKNLKPVRRIGRGRGPRPVGSS